MQVYAATFVLLTDCQLRELGLSSMGEELLCEQHVELKRRVQCLPVVHVCVHSSIQSR